MSSRFVPDSWELSKKLIDWTKSKGITEEMLEDLEERFRDIEFPKPRTCFDRCWRRYIRNGIEWGQIVVPRETTYRKPEEVSPEQKQADILAFERDMKRFGAK